MYLRVGFVVGLIVFFVVGKTVVYGQELWVGKDGNIRNVDTKAMVISNGELLLATKNEIYKARDEKDRWESIFFLPSGVNELTCLAGRAQSIFAGTKKGLFRSMDGGKTWKNVFRTIIPEKCNVLTIALFKENPRNVMIGTEKGLFLSEDSGDAWKDVSGNLKNKRIGFVALNKERVYACTDVGVFVTTYGSFGWTRVYITSTEDKAEAVEGVEASEEAEAMAQGVTCISVKGDSIFAGVGKKILFTQDSGKTWKAFPCDGLGGYVNYIASDPIDRMYCATSQGVFEFANDKQKWIELYRGMDKKLDIKSLVLGEGGGSLWALTENGVYRYEPGKYVIDQYVDIEKGLRTFKIVIDNEPSYKELQSAAIRFADVSPEKMERWKREAKMKALLPKVTFGVDNNRSTNYEIYTSATRDYVTAGPDDLTSGIDVSVSWELGDLIWSDDQTNIDVRSRMTTQLRNDILDDLRRVYYERKRLQFELMSIPPTDMKARFDKEMRIQELGQAIDDLTGNYFSEHLKKSSM